MTILCWNCRGAAKSAVKERCKSLISMYRLEMIILLETQISVNSANRVCRKIFPNWSSFILPSTGRSGGMIISWRHPLIKFNVQSADRQVVTGTVQYAGKHVWSIAAVYASTDYVSRRVLWSNLSSFVSSSTSTLLIGDFNVVTEAEERSRGFSDNVGVMEFRNFISANGLIDMGFKGSLFTWCNMRDGTGRLWERLDRALASDQWCMDHPNAHITHLPRIASDHTPQLLTLDHNAARGPRPFRFENFWYGYERANEIIESEWANEPLGDPAYRVFVKLSNIKNSLKAWNRKEIGNIFEKAKLIEAEIGNLQQKEERGCASSDEAIRIRCLTAEYHNFMRAHEIFWQQKSRIMWVNQGDRNTKFFHRSTIVRRARNLITSIRGDSGEFLTDGPTISQFLCDQFKARWASQDSIVSTPDLSMIPQIIDDSDNEDLSRPVSEEEVFNAIRSMHSDKSPGPDGFPASFYKKYWSTIKSSFMNAVNYFFDTGLLPPQWKSTFLVLIPKCKNPSTFDEFRPISLCNVSYKIIAKVIVNRIKPFLHKIISQEQGAFVPGRSINDNVLLAQEILHSMRYRQIASNHVAVKIDMEKAYDMLDWSFMESTLLKFGFHTTFVNLIMSCVRSPCFSVLVNGTPTDWFVSNKGLRQGDPLAPYLFIIAIEALIRKVKAAVGSGDITPVKVARGAEGIAQLNFADDCLLLFRASLPEAHHIRDILKNFCLQSGEKVNFCKSKVYFGNCVHHRHKRLIKRVLGMHEGQMPMKYLGVVMDDKRLPMRAYDPILARIRSKLAGWKAKSLTFAGRVILIRSVLQAIPSYLLSNGWVPRRITEIMEMEFRRFLWNGSESGRYLSLIQWDKLCQQTKLGGLGFRKLELLYRAFMVKHLVRATNSDSSLWARSVRAKYGICKTQTIVPTPPGASWAWRAVTKASNVLQEQAYWELGNGESIRVGDRWTPFPVIFRPQTTILPSPQNMTVDHLITTSMEWDTRRLKEVFDETTADRITRIIIPKHSVCDQQHLFGKPLTEITVKKVYEALSVASSA